MSDFFKSDICWVKRESENLIYFCGDSFYGYYTLEEFEDLVNSFVKRLEELKRENNI